MLWRTSFCVAVIIASLYAPSKSAAATSLPIAPNEPFRITATVPTNDLTATYAMKLRFFNPITKAYSGETFHGGSWLKQTDSWEDYPTASAGQTMHLIGKTESSDASLILQIAIRKVGATTPTVLQELSVDPYYGRKAIELTAYHPVSGERLTQGYFSVYENGSERQLPLVNSAFVATKLKADNPSIGFYSLSGSLIIPHKSYHLSGDGRYRIGLNAPIAPTYALQLKTPAFVRPYETHEFTVAVTPAYNGGIDWYVDGVKVQSTSSQTLRHSFLNAGRKRIEALLQDTEQSVNQTISVYSYANIYLDKLLPNAQGSDTQSETVVIGNKNPYAVTLTDWSLRSRTSKTTIPLHGFIPASGTLTATTSNKLLNTNGQYDLFNESNELVDTVSYTKTHEGFFLTRSGLTWLSEGKEENEALSQLDSRAIVEGTVIKPSGKTIDIMTASGPVRVVVHKSFNKLKPKLHKGDRIQVSGIWKRSKRGPYLSVRLNDQFIVLAHRAKKIAKSRTRKKRKIKLIETAEAKNPVLAAIPPPKPLIQTHELTLPTTRVPGKNLKFLFALLISLGAVLMSPSPKKDSMP